MGVAKTAAIVAVTSVLAAVAAVVFGGFTEIEHSPASIRTAQPQLTAAEVAAGAGYFRTESGMWLYTHRFPHTSAGDAKGVVLAMHGFGEHILRQGYANVFVALNAAGWDVYAHEHAGHGRSDGERGYNPVFARYVDDALQVHRHVLTTAAAKAVVGAGKPVVLFAHSMGSLVALSALLRTDAGARKGAGLYDAVLLSGTCTFADPELASPAVVAVGRVVANWAPKLPLVALDVRTLTGNATAVAAYDSDPLVYRGGMKALWAANFLDTAATLTASLSRIPPLPLLSVHGARDRICLPQGTRDVGALTASAKAGVATTKLYENGFHELFEDQPTTTAVLADMTLWLDRVAADFAKASAKAQAKAQ